MFKSSVQDDAGSAGSAPQSAAFDPVCVNCRIDRPWLHQHTKVSENRSSRGSDAYLDIAAVHSRHTINLENLVGE